MPAMKKQLTVDQGSTFSRAIRVKETNGTPRDLTGCTSNIVIRRNGVVIHTIACTVTSDGWVRGRMQFTSTLPTGDNTYAWDLVYPSGDITRMFYGPFVVKDND